MMLRAAAALYKSSTATAPLKPWCRAMASSSASSSSKMDGLNDTVTVTKACAKRVTELQKKAGNSNLILRLSVEGGGCSGFQYVFKVEPKEAASQLADRSFSKDGVEVVVDKDSFELIKGATIDFTQELIRSSFVVVNNPQSESACGCGSSFAVKNFSSNPALD